MSFDVDVAVRRGEATVGAAFNTGPGVTVLLGPSGIGKTSILHMIAGLVRPDRGHVRVGGRLLFEEGVDVPVERRRAGVVFQDARLFPHLRVRANLLYGASGPERLNEVATALGVEALLDRWPRTLSGGEARRVAIGRALLSDPAFLLLDEPLASLDPARREDGLRLVERLRDTGLAILMVTHDEREAERLDGTVVRMRPP